jgi:hypothetical protein
MSVLIYPESFRGRIVESRIVDLAWQDLLFDRRHFYCLHDHVVAVSLVIVVYNEMVSGRPKGAFWRADPVHHV